MERAVCSDCGKAYRVADATRSFRCTSCGGRVSAWSAQSRPVPARTRRSIPHERTQASREIGRALGAARAVRLYLIAVAVVQGLHLTISVLQFGALTAALAGSPESAAVTGFTWLVLLIVPIAEFVVVLVAASKVLTNPFPWTVGAATVQTLMFLNSLRGDSAVSALVSGFLAVAIWSALSPIANIRKIRRHYPDMWNDYFRRRKGNKRSR